MRFEETPVSRYACYGVAVTTITAFLKHNFIGKQSQAEPYTAAAHARYIMRKGAASHIYSEHMPRQYHAVQRFLSHHEEGLRKNGRVLDKFIISIPHDVSPEHAVTALKRFGFRMGGGRTPFLFALHGFDTKNHHAHFIFLDRDVDTGKRVFGTTLRNSSASIKIEWETAANQTFAELGYDVRVKVKEGYEEEVANDNSPTYTDASVERGEEEDSLEADATEDAREGDVDMPVIERERDETVSLAGNDVRLLASTVRELNYLHDAQTRLSEAQARYAELVRQREKAKFEANIHGQQALPVLQNAVMAQQRAEQHTRSNGKLKGVGVSLFGFEIKTPARKAAETAHQEAQRASRVAEHVERTQKSYEHRVSVLSAEATQAETEAFNRERQLVATYGDEREIEAAEKAMENTITKVIKDVPPDAAWQAYEDGELTTDELRAYAEQSGNEDLQHRLEESLEEEKESDYSL